MSSLQCFRDLITERLTVAAEEIFRHVERTVVEYEEELDRQRKLLEIVCKPRVKLKRIELPQQHVCQEEEVLTEQQLWNQERNSSLDQEEPESLQIKKEQAEICTSHEGEHLEVKQEADTLLLTPENEESDHMEPERNEEDVDLQHRLHMKWSPVIKLQSTELPQQHVCKEEEVLTEQQLWNQERNSSLDQEEPELLQIKVEQEEICTSHKGEQLEVKQEADTLLLTPVKEERDHMEPEPDSDHQLLSHSSPAAQSQKPFSCTTCGGCFISRKELIVHGRIHYGERPYSCKTCGKRFCRSSDLIRHEKIHTGERSHSCKICGKCFVHRSAVKVHERIHSGEKPYSCKTCGKCFLRRPHLTGHERIHSGERPYSCKTCGKSFMRRPYLVIHERIHSDEKPYSCKTCGKGFIHRRSLVKHEITHTGEKPYSCETCGKGFIQRRSLVKHEITHTGEKPYSCETCEKHFVRKPDLVIHERIHSGEKPYLCKTCGRGFNQKRSLVEHEITHTGEKP
uniref:zinc finger protein 391-like isoform X2 n=1 Tax=Solea senegalensis TaxID=28829 RepID=UPI001CD84AD4|nr:zinc finger protein 391-like isoform X2 [Solea senegalensis]